MMARLEGLLALLSICLTMDFVGFFGFFKFTFGRDGFLTKWWRYIFERFAGSFVGGLGGFVRAFVSRYGSCQKIDVYQMSPLMQFG